MTLGYPSAIDLPYLCSGISLDLEQLRVLEYDGAVGLLGVGGRAAEGLAVGLGQQVVRLGLRQRAAVLLPAQDDGRHGTVHGARQ